MKSRGCSRLAAAMTWVMCAATWNSPRCFASDAYSPPECGANALYLLAKLLDLKPNVREIQALLGEIDEDGSSIAELEAAGRQIGLRLEGRLIRPQDLPLDRPTIAHLGMSGLKSGHFIVLVPVGDTGTMVQMIDPPYHSHLIDYEKLMSSNAGSLRILLPVRPWETSYARAALTCSSMIAAVIGFLLLKMSRRGEYAPSCPMRS